MDLVFQFISMAIRVMWWLIIVRAVLSFIPHNPRQYGIRFIYDVTSPILNPIQKFVPPVGVFDFSPYIALLILGALQHLLP
ncbi:MAG: YggT family protein [Methylocystaceae bacterium]